MGYLVTFFIYGNADKAEFERLDEALAFIKEHINLIDYGDMQLFKLVPLTIHVEI